MRVSVIIPVKPGGEVQAVAGLARVTWPDALHEVLVAEGTRPSRQRNEAARVAQGEILYFLDDDSLPEPGFLERAVGHFADPQVAAVGGPSLTPASDTLRQQAFGTALASLFGGGAVRNRYRKTGAVRDTDDRELILCNLACRRDLFLGLGGLDERLYPNEENELLDRFRKQGLRLVHDPGLAVFRSQRRTWRAFMRQLLTYGRGRGEQTRIDGFGGIATVIPSLFLLYLIGALFVRTTVYLAPLMAYVTALGSYSLWEGFRTGAPALIPRLLLAFPLLHLCYGAGMLWGLLRPRYQATRAEDYPVAIRTVKPFGTPVPHHVP